MRRSVRKQWNIKFDRRRCLRIIDNFLSSTVHNSTRSLSVRALSDHPSCPRKAEPRDTISEMRSYLVTTPFKSEKGGAASCEASDAKGHARDADTGNGKPGRNELAELEKWIAMTIF